MSDDPETKKMTLKVGERGVRKFKKRVRKADSMPPLIVGCVTGHNSHFVEVYGLQEGQTTVTVTFMDDTTKEFPVEVKGKKASDKKEYSFRLEVGGTVLLITIEVLSEEETEKPRKKAK